MKKIICILSILTVMATMLPPALAINVGMYKSESEYGLLDAFEINWKKKNRTNGKKFIQLRDDVYNKRTEKSKAEDLETEYERTRYIYQGEALI